MRLPTLMAAMALLCVTATAFPVLAGLGGYIERVKSTI